MNKHGLNFNVIKIKDFHLLEFIVKNLYKIQNKKLRAESTDTFSF